MSLFDAVLSATGPGDPNHEAAAANLAGALVAQFERTGSSEALDRAIGILRQELRNPLRAKDRQAALLSLLGGALLREAERSGSVTVIKKAVTARRRALRLTGKLDLLYPERMADLGAVLAQQFSMTGDLSVIEEAIRVHRAAVRATFPRDPQLAGRLSNLGTALDWFAMHTGDQGVLRCAVDTRRQAVASAKPDDPNMPMFLSNLAITLMHEYEEDDARIALDEAVVRHRAAVASTPADHVERAPRLANLATALLALFERTGDLAVLDEAIQLSRLAADITPAGHTNRVRYPYGLASALTRRGERTSDLASLDEAIGLLREVVEMTPDGHPNRPGRLSAFATTTYLRFQEAPSAVGELDPAIRALREALRRTAEGQPQRGMILSNLGALLHGRFKLTQEPGTLQEAIAFHREAVAATSPDHSERGKRLSNLVITLIEQSRLTGEVAVLDEAFLACGRALDSLSTGDAWRAQTLAVLGATYARRFELTDDAQALAGGIAAFREAADDNVAPASIRIKAGRDGGRLAASAGSIDDAVRAFGTAVQLVDEAAWTGIGRADQERLLGQLEGLPMDAAAMAIEAGRLEYAVELLEQGRGVLLARRLEAPGQYADLYERAPDFADRLAALQYALEIGGPIAAEDQPTRMGKLHSAADRRSELARQRDSLMAQIRARPDLEDLVAAPQFSRLKAAASHGPVIIVNVSGYRCDALIVTVGDVQLVPLPGLTAQDVADHADALLEATDRASRDVTNELEWLWDSIVEPIFRNAGLTNRPRSRQQIPHVWWCATGVAAFLPLHAAGHYSGGDTALDLVVSSYTPSLRTLIQLRERRAEPVDPERGPLIVAMPQTPNAPDLADAELEAEDLARRFRSCSYLYGPAATHAAVTQAMSHHPWAHFSCHGTQDLLAPSHGRLLLHDQPLAIQQITALRLANTSFAFLSACDTYRGGTGVPDEGITLASALQLAGYQHVIATLWQISGLTASAVARRVYDQIVKDNDGISLIQVNMVAAALRAAIIALRDESPEVPPMYWAAYIHTGP